MGAASKGDTGRTASSLRDTVAEAQPLMHKCVFVFIARHACDSGNEKRPHEDSSYMASHPPLGAKQPPKERLHGLSFSNNGGLLDFGDKAAT